METLTEETEIPPWLKFLQLQFPVLKKPQIDCISRVITGIKSKHRFAAEASHTRMCEVKNMADSMKTNFKLVVEKLQENSLVMHRFQEKYPKWEKSRDLTVSRLRRIAVLMDDQRQESQTNKIGSSLMSLAGGAICIATGGTIPLILGSVLMGFGTLASAGTSDDENKSLQRNIDAAKSVMQMDSQHLEDLFPLLLSLNDAKFLPEEIKSVGHINRERDLAILVETLLQIFYKNSSGSQMGKGIQMLVESLDVPEKLQGAISDIVGIIITIRMLHDRCSTLFNLASKGYSVVSRLRLSVDLFRTACVGINSAVTIKNCCKLTSFQKKMIRGGILFDVINIMVVASQDPNSIEAEEIRKVARQLEKEAKEMNSLYAEIMKSSLTVMSTESFGIAEEIES